MSYDGVELFAIAPHGDDEAPAPAVRLHARETFTREADTRSRPPAGVIRLVYAFGLGQTHPVPFERLDAVLRLAWTAHPLDGGEVRTLAAARIDSSIIACKRLTRDLDALATKIGNAVELDGDHVRRMLEDADALSDPAQADTDALRLAQVLAGVMRGLAAAKSQRSGLIVIRREFG